MMKYKRFMSLVQLQWNYTRGLFTSLLLLLAGGQCYLLYHTLNNLSFQRMEYDYSIGKVVETDNPWSLRFEELLARSHWDKLFLIAFFLTLVLLVSVAFRQKSVAMSDYTYLRLPITKSLLFLSKAFHAFCLLIILLGVQMALILLGYQMYLHMVPKEVVMNQGLFLAFGRWEFLHYIYSFMDPFRMIINVVYLIYLTILVSYLNFSILLKAKLKISMIIALLLYSLFFTKITIVGAIMIITDLGVSTFFMLTSYSKLDGIVKGGNNNDFSTVKEES